jgi:predicted RNA-binding protein with RPS1 domain
LQVGQRYAATVRRTMDYGAFVELAGTGGTQALLHISELDSGRVRKYLDIDGCELNSWNPGSDQT